MIENEIIIGDLIQDGVKQYAFNSSQEISNESYKKNVLSDYIPNTNNQFNISYKSFELIPFKKVIQLKKILRYLVISKKNKLNTTQYSKANRNLRIINSILNGIQDGNYEFYIYNDKIYLKYDSYYGFTKKYDLGRLYSQSASINQLSREFRYYLFKNVYYDIDIVNAHPSILLEYSLKHDLKLPLLTELVYNRSTFNKCIHNEYIESIDESFIKNSEIKKLILACLNMNKTTFVSKSLNQLNIEIQQIRNTLYDEYYLNNDYFKAAIDSRLERNKMDSLTKKQKIQSLYCFNKETENILKFKKTLLKEWLYETTSVVPFFDGLFISNIKNMEICSDTFVVQNKLTNLDDILKKYNETSFIQFKRKEIEPDNDLLTNKQYNKINETINMLDNMTFYETLDLVKKYNIDTSMSTITKDIFNKYKTNDQITFSFEEIDRIKSHILKQYVRLIDQIVH